MQLHGPSSAASALSFALSLALLLAGAAPARAGDPSLVPGAVAPPLADVDWLQGAPVPAWEPGRIYVLDFWATWCGPCRASIPHLNALAQELADDKVSVIGVAIWPKKGMVPTADFVKQQGSAMAYGIAEDRGGKTAASFMAAAGRNGIPTVMIVNGEGRIAWIGHPMSGLTAQLAALVPGFDVGAFEAAAAARIEARKAMKAKMATLVERMKAAEAGQDWQAFSAASHGVLELDPVDNAAYAIYAYQGLVKLDDAAAAQSYGRQAVDGALKDLPAVLNQFAWSIVDPDSATPAERRDLALALAAAQRADELTRHEDPSVLDTLARVQFLGGDTTAAVATQRRALERSSQPGMQAELQARLDEYLRGAGS